MLSKMISTLFLALIILAFSFTSAWALPFNLSFTADNFDVTSPFDSISGSFVYDAASSTSTIDSIISIDLTIGTHDYSLANTVFVSPDSVTRSIVGGVSNANSIVHGTDDFWLYWDFATLEGFNFAYSTADADPGFWDTRNVEIEVTSAGAPVPEPATFILLGSGLLGLFLYRRKR